ncbi:MAG: MFS transporter [Acidimicrobiales bacterium]
MPERQAGSPGLTGEVLTKLRNLGGPGGTGPAATLPGGLRHGMRAFRSRDFRVFFVGALASNSGNWLQNIAVPFVLFELTGRSLWVGLAGFAQFIPGFLLGPFGGSLADRGDRRRVLLVCQGLMAATAFALWGAWALDWRDPTLILGLTAVTGVFSGVMVPSWQAFVPELVDKDDLPSAITLNSTQFNASRAIGPAVAGIVLATAGPGLAFFLNGVSFVAVLAALAAIRVRSERASLPNKDGVAAGFTEALTYIRARTGLMVSIACAMLVAFFGNPVTQFTVVFAEDVYAAGPRVLGVLAAAIGIGAVLIAPALSIWDTTRPRSTVVRFGLPIYALAVMGFGLAPTWPLGLAALLVSGGSFLVVVASTNTSIQLIVADHMRGRVISARVMGFTLAFPLGSLLQGVMADAWGPQLTVIIAGGLLLVAAGVLVSKPGLLASLDRVDDTPDRAEHRSA